MSVMSDDEQNVNLRSSRHAATTARAEKDQRQDGDSSVADDDRIDLVKQSVAAFNRSPAAVLRRQLMVGFTVLCGLLALGSAVFLNAATFVAVCALGILTWLCYFVITGVAKKTYMFGKASQLIIASRPLDWIIGLAGAAVLVIVLVILDSDLPVASMFVVSFVLALVLHLTVDRQVANERREPIERVEQALRDLRRNGVKDEALRGFVCEHGGRGWESFFEAMFGYEAMISARQQCGRDELGRVRRKHLAWRDPIVRWLDARIQARIQGGSEQRKVTRALVRVEPTQATTVVESRAQPGPESTARSPSPGLPAIPQTKQKGFIGGFGSLIGRIVIWILGAPVRFVRRMRSARASAEQNRVAKISESHIALLNARGEVVHGAPGTTSEQGAKAVRLFRTFLATSFRTKASDLHFEPDVEGGMFRMRVDGSMIDVTRVSVEAFPRLLSLVKVLCDVDITQRNIVQEGHFSATVPGRNVDYRVSFAPAVHGQKMVVRILDPLTVPQRTDELLLPDSMGREIRDLLAQQAGMMLVCGPTGSGKTTTLYALLRDIDVKRRNVITIEDPIEYKIEGITQIPVNEQAGNTFSSLLSSVLRQDPDVILVGEVRDPQTARTAMQAAMTGHLVLSTVHAKDTLGTIVRLLDLEVESTLLSSSLNLILAQRLVRTLCTRCKGLRNVTPAQRAVMGDPGAEIKKVHVPVGCPRCMNVGYRGRSAVFELLRVDDTIRESLNRSPNVADLRRSLDGSKHVSLRDMGWQLVVDGQTDVDEIVRVTAQ